MARRRAAHRARLHEAQPLGRRDRAVPDRAGIGSRAPGALRLHRGPQGGGRRLQRKAPPGLQGEVRRMAGLYFEEFSEGRVFEHALTRTVTEMDNVLFTTLTMN